MFGREGENLNDDLACNQLLCRVKRWKIEPIIWHVGHCFVGQRGQNLNYDVTCRALLCRAREGEKLYNDFACSQLLCMAEGGMSIMSQHADHCLPGQGENLNDPAC